MTGPTHQDRLPVSLLTGFLGSGKTTLLSHLLRHPSFSRTAVIINEYGEVGLDHDLVEASEESFVTLQTGCLCCAIRGDLVRTLDDLLARRDAGTVPRFERIVIETSGLADPAPAIQAIMLDEALATRLSLTGVVTTVDALNGFATLEAQSESVKQAAVADRLVLTKTDLSGAPDAALLARLAALNPAAPQLVADHGRIDPALLLDSAVYDPSGKIADVARWLGRPNLSPPPLTPPHEGEGYAGLHHHHAPDILCHSIMREKPLPAVALTLFLEILAEHFGADILRLKGIVHLAESPERPTVIHGVQHVFHPPAWLERWPSDDRRTRLVLITRGVPRAFIETLIEALDVEVSAVATCQRNDRIGALHG